MKIDCSIFKKVIVVGPIISLSLFIATHVKTPKMMPYSGKWIGGRGGNFLMALIHVITLLDEKRKVNQTTMYHQF